MYAGTISIACLFDGPLCELKYRRSRFGLKHGPVISESLCKGSARRQNGATSPSGLITTSSMLPPSSATNKSPDPSSTVTLSTPVSG